MKKKILCFFMAIALVIPTILTSCSKTRTDEEILAEITGAGVTALTLSVWLPTDAENVTEELYSNKTDAEKEADGLNVEFLKRLRAVEDALNKLLVNDYTKIKLQAISDDKYEQTIEKRFNDIKENIKKDKTTALQVANGYVNQGRFDENKQPELVYPDVIEEKQLDICLVRGYDNYISNISNGNLYALDKYLSANGGTYSYYNKMIKSDILGAMKIDGVTYAIPNNHQYADDSYQFILINKELFDSFEEFDIKNINSLLDCEEYLKAVGNSGKENVTPLVANLGDVSNIKYWTDNGKFSLISSVDANEPSSTLDNQDYIKFVSMYKELTENGFVSETEQDGFTSAVKVTDGKLSDIEEMEDEYYILKSEVPVASAESVYSSMFAVSTYSANHDRAMKILYKIQTNSEIRTLLQYGIEDVDYTKDYTDNDTAVLKLKKTAYKMNLLYTGNEYMTYKGEGCAIDEWDYIKSLNYDMKLSSLFGLDIYFSNLSETDKQNYSNTCKDLNSLSETVYNDISVMTKEEFDKFIEIYNKYKNSDIEKLSDEEKAEYNSVPTVAKVVESQEYKKALDDYKKLFNDYSK